MLLNCPICDTVVNAPESSAGNMIRCTSCDHGVIYVPNPDARYITCSHSTCESCFWAEWDIPKMRREIANLAMKFINEQMGLPSEFGSDDSELENKPEGQCRRFPPKTIVEMSSNEDGVHSSSRTSFPTINPDDWCGEWKPKQ